MPDWLAGAISVESTLTQQQIFVRLLMAVIYGGAVAAIYRLSHGRIKDDASVLIATLVLLSVLIAMVSMVIGDSVARAFSLVGALSIVRFRTVVDDTRDTAFVIFAVIVGMAAGAGLLLVPIFGIPIVGVVAMLLSRASLDSIGSSTSEATVNVRVALGQDPASLEPVLKAHGSSVRLLSAETARQGAALDVRYGMQLSQPGSLVLLVKALNQVEGVQSAEVKMS
jgi:hypothetical protein